MSRDAIEALLELDKRKVRLIPHTSRYTCDGDGKEYQVHARWYQHQVNPVQFSQPVLPVAFYSHFPKTHVSVARESVEDPAQFEKACCLPFANGIQHGNYGSIYPNFPRNGRRCGHF